MPTSTSRLGALASQSAAAGEAPEARRLAVGAALLAVYVIWGSTYYAMRVALEELPPFLMAGPRFLVAGLAMYAWLRARGHAAPSRAGWIASAKIGALLLVVGNGAVAIAQRGHVPSGTAAVVVASMPIWAAVFGRLFGARSSGREWIGLLLGFGGVVLRPAVATSYAYVNPVVALGLGAYLGGEPVSALTLAAAALSLLGVALLSRPR